MGILSLADNKKGEVIIASKWQHHKVVLYEKYD
jgi:hypothetical protein